MTEAMAGVRVITNNPQETSAIAAMLAEGRRAGDCLLLRGDLGAGKTQFARGFIHALSGSSDEIVSPTFTLVQTYPATEATLWHFDLYRLERVADIYETGIEDALHEGITLIEWPECIRHLLPENALDVHIAYGKHDNERVISFTGNPAQWKPYFDRLERYDPTARNHSH